MLIASRITYLYCAAMFILGVSFHSFQKVAKHYHLVEYVQEPPRRNKKKAGAPTGTYSDNINNNNTAAMNNTVVD